jgi:hypothetical protein
MGNKECNTPKLQQLKAVYGWTLGARNQFIVAICQEKEKIFN